MTRRRVVTAFVAAGLVAAAFTVALTKPGDYAGQEPFEITVQTGERGTGRDIEARFDGARLAREVEVGTWQGGTTGIWVVVDAAFASVLNDRIGDAELRIGERSWTASPRPSTGTLHSAPLSPRMPVAGVLVFEIPAEALDEPAARDASVSVGGAADNRLDSVITWRVDLAALDVEQRVEEDRAEATSW